MIFKFIRLLKKYALIAVDVFFVKVAGRYPIFYFDDVPNVGDLINPYLIKKLSKKKCHQVKSRSIKHTVGLGSMFHMANHKSVIWGTGIISNSEKFRHKTKCLCVKAVRGTLTKGILIENGVISNDNIVLGDPGLLMSLYYQPDIKKEKKIGVIPHYVDFDHSYIKDSEDIFVIDVRQYPERFIDQLLKCEFIVSSSLHGLILADSYSIPNKWVSFSNKITGGSFKYYDYYSTTDHPNEECVAIDGKKDFQELISNIESYASVKKYTYDKKDLINSFPVF